MLCERWMSVQNFMVIHLTVVEIFQTRPKWRTDRWTNDAIPRVVLSKKKYWLLIWDANRSVLYQSQTLCTPAIHTNVLFKRFCSALTMSYHCCLCFRDRTDIRMIARVHKNSLCWTRFDWQVLLPGNISKQDFIPTWKKKAVCKMTSMVSSIRMTSFVRDFQIEPYDRLTKMIHLLNPGGSNLGRVHCVHVRSHYLQQQDLNIMSRYEPHLAMRIA